LFSIELCRVKRLRSRENPKNQSELRDVIEDSINSREATKPSNTENPQLELIAIEENSGARLFLKEQPQITLEKTTDLQLHMEVEEHTQVLHENIEEENNILKEDYTHILQLNQNFMQEIKKLLMNKEENLIKMETETRKIRDELANEKSGFSQLLYTLNETQQKNANRTRTLQKFS